MTTKTQNENFRQWVRSEGWQHHSGVAYGIAYYRCGSLIKARRLCFDDEMAWFESDLIREESVEIAAVNPGPTVVASLDGLMTVATEEEGPLLKLSAHYRQYRHYKLPVYFHRSGLRVDFAEHKKFSRQDDGVLLPQEAAEKVQHLVKQNLRPHWLSNAATRYRIARCAKRVLAQPLLPPLLPSPLQATALSVPSTAHTISVAQLVVEDNGLSDEFFTELAARRGYRLASEFESRLRAGASQQELMLLLLRE